LLCEMKKYCLPFFSTVLIFVLLAACGPAPAQQADITVSISADGNRQEVTVPSGNTVQQALSAAKITLSQTDRVDPAAYTVLTAGMTVVVTRVREEFETQQVVIPFERQELRNESLPSGETHLVQAGQNGLSEITIRHVFENGVDTGSSTVSETVLQAAIPEIVMIGVQSPFAPLSIPGTLVYLTGGNVWVMQNSTANRRPLITSGDLDGHIFSLSPDGKWLLFSRKSTLPADQQINTLWAVSTTDQPAIPVNLGIANVVHFADWQPGENYLIAYSTVEPRATAPGWQANNDLHFLTFEKGKPGKIYDILEANSGGIYGWWGMSLAWSPDGKSLAYSRPDGIGLVDINGSGLTTLLSITPFNTHGDWAWTPGMVWGRDGKSLYLVNHAAPTGLVTPEESPNFDLATIDLSSNVNTTLVQQTGMFAYPETSPLQQNGSGSSYQIAYLQAIFTAQSATSHYRLFVMGNDGKNPRLLFPAEGQPGLDPQKPVWAPTILDSGSNLLALVYEGNLWIIDATSGQSQQVTGDGLTNTVDWK
jgi:resuscitation-promoting factor RpfB